MASNDFLVNLLEEARCSFSVTETPEEEAEVLMAIDSRLWTSLGIRSGSQLDRDTTKRNLWEAFWKDLGPHFDARVVDILEDENHHSLACFFRSRRAS